MAANESMQTVNTELPTRRGALERDKERIIPNLGAVVTNFNGGTGVLKCIESLVKAGIAEHEIVVVDGASSDDSVSRIRACFPEARLVQLGSNLGPCVARNTGMRELSTDLAILIDDDVRLAPTALEYMLAVISETAAKVVCPRILLYPQTDIIHADGVEPHFLGTMSLRHGFAELTSHSDKSGTPQAVEVGGCLSACILVERSVVLGAGGFDETYFFYFEDLEFSIRIRSLGFAIYCVEQAIAYHERGSGTSGLSFRGRTEYPEKRFYLSARNRLMTILIHFRLRTIIALMPVFIVYEVMTVIFAISQGFFSSYVRSIRWHVQNRQSICERRLWAQQARIVPDTRILRGGRIPLAPGLVQSRFMNGAVAIASFCFDFYWRIVKLFFR